MPLASWPSSLRCPRRRGRQGKADRVWFTDHRARIPASRAAGRLARKLKVVPLEENHELQEAVLSVHHTCIHTLRATNAFKIIENHQGLAFIQGVQQLLVQAQQS